MTVRAPNAALDRTCHLCRLLMEKEESVRLSSVIVSAFCLVDLDPILENLKL